TKVARNSLSQSAKRPGRSSACHASSRQAMGASELHTRDQATKGSAASSAARTSGHLEPAGRDGLEAAALARGPAPDRGGEAARSVERGPAGEREIELPDPARVLRREAPAGGSL